MPRQSRFTPDVFAEWQRLYESGMSTKQIGVMFDVDGGTVYDRLRQMGITTRSPSEGRRIHHANHDAFASVSDEPTAYWLGFLFADGCVHYRRGDVAGYVEMALQEQAVSHIRAFLLFAQSNHPIHHDEKRRAYRVSITSKTMADDLTRLGCTPRKSLTLVFPDLPPHLQNHFIRGYFDADGSAFASGRYKEPTINMIGTQAFLEAVREVVTTYTHASGGLHRHIRKRSSYLVYKGAFSVQAVQQWMYDEATIWLERKRAVIDSFREGKRLGYPTAKKYK